MDGLIQMPGRNAGNTGNNVQMGRLHYTVGTDSTAIGVAGYFHFLVPKDGTPIQFAPTEAVCWDACEWNPTGVGIEFERLSDAEPLTENQIFWGGQIINWLSQTHGIPLELRDSPDDRMAVGTDFHGFTTHRSLHEVLCDEHYDYITQADWDAMLGTSPAPAPTPSPEEDDDMAQTKAFWVTLQGAIPHPGAAILCVEDPVKGRCSTWITDPATLGALPAAGVLDLGAHNVGSDIFIHYPLLKSSPDPRKK